MSNSSLCSTVKIFDACRRLRQVRAEAWIDRHRRNSHKELSASLHPASMVLQMAKNEEMTCDLYLRAGVNWRPSDSLGIDSGLQPTHPQMLVKEGSRELPDSPALSLLGPLM